MGVRRGEENAGIGTRQQQQVPGGLLNACEVCAEVLHALCPTHTHTVYMSHYLSHYVTLSYT